MPQKRSKGVTIFSVIEILLGISGSILFFMSVQWVALNGFYLISTSIDKVFTVGVNPEALTLGFMYCIMTLPFAIILISGIYTLRLRSWARKINFIFLPPLLFSVSTFAYFGFPLFGKIIKWKSFFITVIPLFVLTVLKIWYFTRPKVKQQFLR
jgi:hypothetical protein